MSPSLKIQRGIYRHRGLGQVGADVTQISDVSVPERSRFLSGADALESCRAAGYGTCLGVGISGLTFPSSTCSSICFQVVGIFFVFKILK